MTRLEIVNGALVLMGESPVSSLEDRSVQVQHASMFYAMCRKECLQWRNWTFAERCEKLARVESAGGKAGYGYVYALPNDFLCLVRLTEEDDILGADGCIRDVVKGRASRFRIMGWHVLSDLEEVELQYVADVFDENMWSPSFCEVMQYMLASKLAGSLRGDAQMASQFRANAEQLANVASARDGRQNRYGNTENAYVNARR